MDVNVFDFDYSKQKEFYFLLASDLHIGDRLFDLKKFTHDFQKAKDLNARIYLNGDVMRLITIKDFRRYTKDEDKPGLHIIDDQIEEAYELLKPYADNIDIIGIGNHETAVVKYFGSDPVKWLIQLLNEVRDKKRYGLIRHGGYSGFIKQMFRFGKSRTKTYTIWYNHGTGKGGEVTGDMISLNRRKVYIEADLLWLAHTHHYQFDGGGDIVYLNNMNEISIKKRRGIVTGCYLKQVEQTDSKSGYRYSFGEQSFRRIQSQGSVLMMHSLKGKDLSTLFLME